MYQDMNTGYFYTADEVKDLYEQYKWELERHYDSFDEYMDEMVKKGNMKEVDKDDIEEMLADELFEMIALGWTDEEARGNEDAFFERIDKYTDVLTKEDIWRVWQNALDISAEEQRILQ